MAVLDTTPEETTAGISEAYKTVEDTTTAGTTVAGLPDYKQYDAAKVSSDINKNVLMKPGEAYVPPSATVQGQLTSLLSRDNAYTKQARVGAAEEAQAAGMLSTSLAAGAGEQAAIKSALPIAQQDADTYAKAKGLEQQYGYELEKGKGQAIMSAEMVEQDAAIKMQNQNIQNAFNTALQGAGEEAKVWLGDLNNTYQTQLQDLKFTQETLMKSQDMDAVKAESIRSTTSNIMQNYQISVENLMTDPDFLQLGPDAVNKAIEEMQQLARNSILFVGSSSNVDLTPFVDEYLTPITVMEPTV